MTNMKKNILHIALMLLPIVANAEEVEIDGLWYSLDANTKEAIVISSKSVYYSGLVEIPAVVTYGGAYYNVSSIGGSAFSSCSDLTSVTIPGSVKEIYDRAFKYCSSLESVVMEEGVKMIYEDVFGDCFKLTSISFPSTLEYMGLNSSLEYTQWYKNQTGDVVYAGPICYKYKGSSYNDLDITIKEGTKGIAAGAFQNCSNLKSIVFPDGLTTVGEWAFGDCYKLQSVVFPESIRNIWQNAFTNTAWYNNQPDGLVYAGSVLYSYKGTMPENTEISIPDGTKGIAQSAFLSCANLSSVIIPNSVETMGWAVFSCCTGLVSIEFPNSINTIPNFACYSCSNLKYVTIPHGITKVVGNSFQNCSSLMDVICYADQVPSANEYTFTLNNIANATLHVPESSLEAYSTIEPWSHFGSIVAIKEPTLERCATPTISFSNGKVRFNCETEDVEFVSRVIVENSETELIGREIDLGTTFMVSVYARREGYLDSDIATSSFTMTNVGDVNADGELNAADITAVVNAILGK